jgi:solute carrier family 50 protein (sugar transporter)
MNIAGTVIELFWCTVYFVYSHEKRIFVLQFGSIVAFVLFVVFFCKYYIGSLHATPILPKSTLEGDIIGIVAGVIVVGMYAAPLGIVGQVIRTRSTEYMPFSLCMMCLVNSSVQSVYAVSILDWLYIVPNCLGVIVSIAQLVVYTVYCGRSVEQQPDLV